MSLLSNGCHYLAHVVIKGLKGSFIPIESWVNELIKNVNFLVRFVITDKTDKVLTFIYQANKPGLVSKSIDVSRLSLQFFSSFMKILSQNNFSNASWDWFMSENSGLNACLNCINMQEDLEKSVIDTIMEYSKFNTFESLTTQMKNKTSSPLEYLKMIKMILKAIESNVQFNIDDVNHNNDIE